MQFIDDFLNKITMYKLVLYSLVFLVLVAFTTTFIDTKAFPFSSIELLYSVVTFVFIAFVTNKIFSWAFDAPTNVESVYITAFILVLILDPKTASDSISYLIGVCLIAALSMVSKYILAIKRKHIFNPVAIAVVIATYTINESASWWIGTSHMTPFVFIVGFLIVRKIRRSDMVLSFVGAAFLTTIIAGFIKGTSFNPSVLYTLIAQTINQTLFLAVFMLTEPLTTPPTRGLRIIYGSIVGLLLIPTLHLAPEVALVLGNIFSYIVSPKDKLLLALSEKIRLATDTYEFSFPKPKSFVFTPGQYMEFTLPHRDPDGRGNRRYFTIASSPTENSIKLGLKFYPEPSSFKNKLLAMAPGEIVTASQCAGDFVLPKDTTKKLVFIAGGIGVTPFRSMIKYCLDRGEKRDIVILYSNRNSNDIAYREIFDEAKRQLGIETTYMLTDKGQVATDSYTRLGFLDGTIIEKEIPDYNERTFYISGPHSMVTLFEKMLHDLGVSKNKIKTDFFPGFA